jgi:hypothetical protein
VALPLDPRHASLSTQPRTHAHIDSSIHPPVHPPTFSSRSTNILTFALMRRRSGVRHCTQGVGPGARRSAGRSAGCDCGRSIVRCVQVRVGVSVIGVLLHFTVRVGVGKCGWRRGGCGGVRVGDELAALTGSCRAQALGCGPYMGHLHACVASIMHVHVAPSHCYSRCCLWLSARIAVHDVSGAWTHTLLRRCARAWCAPASSAAAGGVRRWPIPGGQPCPRHRWYCYTWRTYGCVTPSSTHPSIH